MNFKLNIVNVFVFGFSFNVIVKLVSLQLNLLTGSLIFQIKRKQNLIKSEFDKIEVVLWFCTYLEM